MPLIVTPARLSQRADFYHQLHTMASAGIGLVEALTMEAKAPPDSSYKKPLGIIIGRVNQGSTFAEALAATGSWTPAFDVALIEAAEKSGRLDVCFKLLSHYYSGRASLARSVISDLAYPLFVIHAAILIFPTSLLAEFVWQGLVAKFVIAKISMLAPLYGGIAALLYACQAKRGEKWRAKLETITSYIPLLSKALRDLALARLAGALEGLISAGVSIIEAWDIAAAASGSPALRREIASIKPKVLAGQTPGDAISASKAFPEMFSNLYRTGEVSGQLDTTLRRLNEIYQDQGSRKLKAVAQWTPRLIYMIIALIVAYQVVAFYSGYFKEIEKVL